MTNLKRTFKKTLKEWGHDVLFQRILENGNHSDRFQRITVRSVGQSGSANTDSMRELDEGITVTYDAVYYVESEIMPREGDRIYEGYSSKPGKKNTIFTIEAVTPMRGKFGEIIFWVIGTTREK